MFESLGRFAFRFRFLVVAGWLVAAIAGLLLAPNLADVGSADQSTFLPAETESMTARDTLARAFPGDASAGTATIAFSRPTGLTDADRAFVGSTAAWLADAAPAALRDVIARVVSARGHPELAGRLDSTDGTMALVQVELGVSAFEPAANDAVAAMREHLAATLPAGLTANVTGSAGIGADYLASITEATDRTTIVTIVLVVLVLLLIYRAPLAALVPLATIGAAYLVSRAVLGVLGEAGWQISSLLGTFVVVLVFGVGTDYTIFLISRFREEVGRAEWAEAVGTTVRRIGAVIAASAATVAIGLASMAAGQFVMFQTTGPALALAILVTLAAGLTLAPALLAIFGHHLFWPTHQSRLAGDERRGFFGGLAALIGRRPLAVTLVVLVALGVPAVATTGLRQTFDVLADLPASSDARAGFDLVASRFDKGALLPIEVVVDGGPGADLGTSAALAQLRSTTDRLLATDGVRRVESLVAPSGDGSTPDAFRPSRQLAMMAERFAVPADPASGLRKLLDPATTNGLRSAAGYLADLAPAYPDVAASDAFAAARADLEQLPLVIGALRAALAASSDPNAVPDPATAEVQGRVARLAGRLPAELSALSTTFATRSDDLFIPTATGSADGRQLGQAVAAYLSADRSVARLTVIAADDPYARGAFDTVGRVRATLAADPAAFGPDATVSVGGQTAIQVDLQATINRDFLRVAALTVFGVLVVLALLLRSLVAPLYLVGTVLLSYLCTLGLSSVWFQDVLGQPGMNYFLPLMVFVLLVALGSDYNIFLMSRVREESEARGTRDGIRAASARTGAVITSAGIILAGTFLAMVGSPLVVLFQVGLMVALGVLIDTFVVRSLLVPAITTLLGDAAWWPFGRRASGDRPAASSGAGPRPAPTAERRPGHP